MSFKNEIRKLNKSAKFNHFMDLKRGKQIELLNKAIADERCRIFELFSNNGHDAAYKAVYKQEVDHQELVRLIKLIKLSIRAHSRMYDCNFSWLVALEAFDFYGKKASRVAPDNMCTKEAMDIIKPCYVSQILKHFQGLGFTFRFQIWKGSYRVYFLAGY